MLWAKYRQKKTLFFFKNHLFQLKINIFVELILSCHEQMLTIYILRLCVIMAITFLLFKAIHVIPFDLATLYFLFKCWAIFMVSFLYSISFLIHRYYIIENVPFPLEIFFFFYLLWASEMRGEHLLSQGCRWGICHSWSHSFSDLYQEIAWKIENKWWKSLCDKNCHHLDLNCWPPVHHGTPWLCFTCLNISDLQLLQ